MLAANLMSLGLWLFQEGEEAAGFDPLSMWHSMGWPARIVVIVLFIMSAWSIGVMIDRWIAFSSARKQSRVFAPAVAGALKDGKIDEAISIAEQNKRSHLAKVVTAGLQEFQAHQVSAEIPGETIEASKRALERAAAIVHAELKRGVSTLATIGSTAPFVGLFGTVLGIIHAFEGICRQQVHRSRGASRAEFPKPSSPPPSVCSSPSRPCGFTTISPPRSNRSTSRWITPPRS